jgi:large repetitive protein
VNGTPVAIVDGYSVREGSSVVLKGSGSDPERGPMTFTWDLSNDGAFETTGQNASFSAARIDGPASRTSVLRVCDNVGACAVAPSTVRITNVPPKANAGPNRRTKAGRRIRFRGRATDPGTGDRKRFAWRFGDGRRASGASPRHRYRRPGRYVVRLTVTDDDGGRSTDTARVRVVR